MVLPTNRSAGQQVSSSDIDNIAAQVNANTAALVVPTGALPTYTVHSTAVSDPRPPGGNAIQVNWRCMGYNTTPTNALAWDQISYIVTVDPLVNTVRPVINDLTPTVGEVVSVDNGTWQTSPNTFAYQWFADGVQINGATANTFLVTSTQTGRSLMCRVTGTTPGTDPVFVNSGVTANVISGVTPLVNTVLPTINRTAPQVGQVLTTEPGTWTGSPTSFTYQWKASGTNISGATNASFTVTSAQVGATLTCVVGGVKTGTPTVYAVTAATSAVATTSGGAAHLIGSYDGNGGQATTFGYFNEYPEVATWYFNYNQSTLNAAGIKAQMDLGICPVITWDTKVNPNSDGTQGTGVNDYHHQISIRSGVGYTAYQQFLATIRSLDTYAASKGVTLYVTIDHEAENNYHQNKFLVTQTVNDWAGCMSNFYADLKASSPALTNTKSMLWTGYYNYQRSTTDPFQIKSMGALLTSWPDVFTMDPYQETSTQTLTALLSKYVAQVQAWPWYIAHPCPIGCTEMGSFGVTDAQFAAFLTNQHAVARSLDLEMIILFNRTGPGGLAQQIQSSTYPQATAAEAASLGGS